MARRMIAPVSSEKRHAPSLRVDPKQRRNGVSRDGRYVIEVRCYDRWKPLRLREDVNALNGRAARPDALHVRVLRKLPSERRGRTRGRRSRLWFLAAFRGKLIGYLPMRLNTPRAFGVGVPVLDVTHTRPPTPGRRGLERGRGRTFGITRTSGSVTGHARTTATGRRSPLLPESPVGYRLRSGAWRLHHRDRWESLSDYRRCRRNLQRPRGSCGTCSPPATCNRIIGPGRDTAAVRTARSIEPHSWKSRANADVGRHPTRIEHRKGLLDPRQPMRISIQILLLNGMPIAD
jgi:hypothetical protein